MELMRLRLTVLGSVLPKGMRLLGPCVHASAWGSDQIMALRNVAKRPLTDVHVSTKQIAGS